MGRSYGHFFGKAIGSPKKDVFGKIVATVNKAFDENFPG
jgi:hypothetical protein